MYLCMYVCKYVYMYVCICMYVRRETAEISVIKFFKKTKKLTYNITLN